MTGMGLGGMGTMPARSMIPMPLMTVRRLALDGGCRALLGPHLFSGQGQKGVFQVDPAQGEPIVTRRTRCLGRLPAGEIGRCHAIVGHPIDGPVADTGHQVRRRVHGHDLTTVQEGHPVGQELGLFDVVGGEKNGRAVF